MKSVLLVCLLVFVVVAMAQELSVDDEWTNFKTKYDKSYGSEEEEAKRREIFAENLQKIREHNQKYEAGEVTFKQAVNKFADQTPEEFRSTHLGVLKPSNVGSSVQ